MNISNNEIHLWICHDEECRDTDLLSKYHELLNVQEKDQEKRFYFEDNRHQYLITRALVRSVLSLYINQISPEDWIFSKNDFGKPFIANRPLSAPLQFNVAHTKRMVVLAVTLNQEVGVDVEYLPRQGKSIDIADRYFSTIESEELSKLPVNQQSSRFFDLWTLKEAYIKACGQGLSIPLDQFSYTFPKHNSIRISFAPERNDQPDYWNFWQFQPSRTHKIAVAIKAEEVETPYSLSLREITPLGNISEHKDINSMGFVKAS